MIKRIIQTGKGIFFPLILFFLTVYLAWVNYKPGTFLSGWDTLHPEFNFPLNFQRVIDGVWREEQGLGAVAAHAHMADLPRIIILYLLSFAFPLNTLRYLYIFLCLVLGPLGMFYFLRYTLKNKSAAFFGALFYLLNPATLQTFYVPFEMFTTQYAFFPWLFLLATKFVWQSKQKDLFWFALVTLLAVPMAYAPQLWWVYFISLLLYISLIGRIRQIGVIVIITLAVNAFWLLPHFYFLKNNAWQVPEAKINQLFSEEAFLKNKKWANFLDLAFLRGPLLDWQEYDGEKFIPLMEEWQKHWGKFGFLGSLGVLGVGLGILRPVWIWAKRRQKALLPKLDFGKMVVSLALLPVLFLAVAFLLNVNLPVFGGLFAFLRERSSLFAEALRFPYTKFSLLLVFACSFYFAQANLWFLDKIAQVCNFVKALKDFSYLSYRCYLVKIYTAVIALALIVYMRPAFSGYLIDPWMKIKIPQEYFALFDWFAKQGYEEGRIAVLPDHSFWGWEYYNFGFQGAGFIWFGLPQSVLVRDFDRWNPKNENFYWEVSYALYSGNRELFEKVLEKYQVSWLLVDENVISPDSPKTLYFEKLEELIGESEEISLAREFGKIRVYKSNMTYTTNKIYIKEAVQVEPGYTWGNFDQAYFEGGDYWTNKSHETKETNGSYWFYPFRSLFTRGKQEERGVEIEEREDEYIIKNTILRYYLPRRQAGDITILENSKLVVPDGGEELVEVDKEDLEKVRYLKPEIKGREDGDNSWTAVGKVLAERSLGVRVPKIWGVYSYKSEKDPDFSGKKIFQGDSFADIYLPNLPHRYSYLVAIEARNLAGRPLLFWVENLNSRRQDLQTYLEKGESWQKHYFVLPPMEKNGMGYTLHFENTPVNGEQRENEVRRVTVNPFPYKFLTGLKLVNFSDDRLKYSPLLVLPQSFERGWKLYKVSGVRCQVSSKYQVSSLKCKVKSFLAEKLPFVFGEEVKNHVLVNNWANGWIMEKSKVPAPEQVRYGAGVSQKLKVVYLPQYLQYLGFVILLVTFLFFLKPKKRHP